MRSWLVALAGLLVWLAHFMGVYGLASLEAVRGDDHQNAMIALSLICGAAAVGLMITAALRGRSAQDEPARFIWFLSAATSLVGLAGIAFQTSAALLT